MIELGSGRMWEGQAFMTQVGENNKRKHEHLRLMREREYKTSR